MRSKLVADQMEHIDRAETQESEEGRVDEWERKQGAWDPEAEAETRS